MPNVNHEWITCFTEKGLNGGYSPMPVGCNKKIQGKVNPLPHKVDNVKGPFFKNDMVKCKIPKHIQILSICLSYHAKLD